MILQKPLNNIVMEQQLENIKEMEALLDQLSALVLQSEEMVTKMEQAQPDFRKLMDYYDSGEWRKDNEDHNSGTFPEDLKCGVLSEDAVYNLYGDFRNMALRMIKLGVRILE